MAASSNGMFGLSDSEVKIALCSLKLMVADGQGKVDKDQLAALTGHTNPDSANRVWYMARKKMIDNDASTPAGSSTSLDDIGTPTKGPKKTPSKMGSKTPKKRTKKQAEVEDDEAEAAEQPAKRIKKEAAADAEAANLEMEDEV
ncbi:hypothetical protein N8I77_010262 [Diaporthe amygdali]|uniref:Uncharacterized protein n=1 Tax=Phomopsis amygdali TaxID=1214568 RepID=A0AAD9S7Z0_PHOAM|nr:hypothetical protein N8I77_010262 [Diaporthe amygdali]